MLEATVIIVNFRTEDLVMDLMEHLNSRDEERPRQVIIVDNSPERGLGNGKGLDSFPAMYINAGGNVGFAAAINKGIRQATGEILILLNPDTRPEAGCLRGLMEILMREPANAAAGPRLIPMAPQAPPVPSATRRDPCLLTAVMEYTVAHRFASPDWLDHNYFVNPYTDGEPVECAMIQGACFAFKRSWIKPVGFFDSKRFFLYWEDTDFCRRIRNKGGKVLYCPSLICAHQGGASLEQGAQDTYQFWHGFYAYQKKYHGPAAATLARLLLTGGMGLEWLILLGLHIHRRGSDRTLISHMKILRSRLREQFWTLRQGE